LLFFLRLERERDQEQGVEFQPATFPTVAVRKDWDKSAQNAPATGFKQLKPAIRST
jgi:hypothetical protein